MGITLAKIKQIVSNAMILAQLVLEELTTTAQLVKMKKPL